MFKPKQFNFLLLAVTLSYLQLEYCEAGNTEKRVSDEEILSGPQKLPSQNEGVTQITDHKIVKGRDTVSQADTVNNASNQTAITAAQNGIANHTNGIGLRNNTGHKSGRGNDYDSDSEDKDQDKDQVEENTNDYELDNLSGDEREPGSKFGDDDDDFDGVYEVQSGIEGNNETLKNAKMMKGLKGTLKSTVIGTVKKLGGKRTGMIDADTEEDDADEILEKIVGKNATESRGVSVHPNRGGGRRRFNLERNGKVGRRNRCIYLECKGPYPHKKWPTWDEWHPRQKSPF